MPFETIKTSDMDNYINKANTVIIDLRDRSDYIKGHIPGAINVQYEDLHERMDELPKNMLIVFYCDRGHVSLLAARDLMKNGYNIRSLYGGIHSYRGKLEGVR